MILDITIAITSCGRTKLLKKTIESLAKSCDLSKYTKIITEDSTDKKILTQIKNENKIGFLKGWKIIFTGNKKNTNPFLSHKKALEILYSNIGTKYCFHCEDDWFFRKVDFDFIQLSKSILETNSKIGIIGLHDWYKKDAYNIKMSRSEIKEKYFTSTIFSYFGFKFIRMKPLNNISELYLLNPGLRRTEEAKKIIFGYEGILDEYKHGEIYKNMGLFTVNIEHGIYTHIGGLWKSTSFLKDGLLKSLLRASKNAFIHYKKPN